MSVERVWSRGRLDGVSLVYVRASGFQGEGMDK